MALTAEEVAEIRRRTGLTQEAFANRIGEEPWVIKNAENNRKQVKGPLERKIREAAEIGPDDEIVIHGDETSLERLPPNLAFVEFWNQTVEGGDGAAEVEHEHVVDYLAFNKAWLKGAAPSGNLRAVKAVRVRKESMAPDIRHGDVILVDIVATRALAGEVYVIRRAKSGGLVVKELRKHGSEWLAHSRNKADGEKAFPVALDVEGGDTVKGRVFWRCGRIEKSEP